MNLQSLSPWLKGNESITPNNFYHDLKPCFEMGAFVALDFAVELYLANTVNTGNLRESWKNHKKYIEKACKIAGIEENSDYDLDNEQKYWILEELGDPPTCCYNLYFITIYNEEEEKLVYIGKTDSENSRFANGHIAALKLHHPKYSKYNKRVYFGTIMFLSDDKEYIPLEFIQSYDEAKKYLGEMEALLIAWFKPELNIRKETAGEMKDLSIVHIQNFSDVSDFLNDYMVYKT